MSEMAAWQKIVRQAQRALGLLTRPATLGVRAIALDAAGRVFLVRHTYTPGFYLPGGGVESGETALAALARELSEEGGLECSEPPRLIGFYYNPRHSRRDHVALYVANNVRQTRNRAPDWEIAESGFFALDALPAEATVSTRARLAEYFEAAPPDPIW
ncbi:NUDIX domain-containing protein [uncultured Rhodoblastus sp.]|uniref:NUDIX domain-containing protein n=1 Tax=uncultured Rhodoblastus sp. TaxID=543037 RepID=UPI0025D76A5F|nr:NUDIX domain-containing protein [uncultured Rhodoblastus sp.]